MKNLSTKTYQILFNNTFQFLEGKERRTKIYEILKSSNGKNFIQDFIDDLESDAELTKNDFPKHSKEYVQAAEELKKFL